MSTLQWKEDIVELGKLGRERSNPIDRYDQLTLDHGLHRLEGSTVARLSKEYVIERMREAGLEVRIDKIGNIFARKEGTEPGIGSVMSGSHLDSVPNGGMFDGVVGVVGALEAVRRLSSEGFNNRRPFEVAIFLDEEGSSFNHGLLGSSVLVGQRPLGEALGLKNDQGLAVKEALEQVDLIGDFDMDLDGVEYFVEMHIEQGPVLDNEGIDIGIVENITGVTWLTATIEGQANHAGTTPMAMRRDPLVAASEIPPFVDRVARERVEQFGGSTTATVGRMISYPGVVNIIPGKVDLSVDIRDGKAEILRELKEKIAFRIKKLEDDFEVRCMVDTLVEHPPSACAKEVVSAIKHSTTELGFKAKRMNSGAAHDAQNMSKKVKTGMLFVPSVDGISHSPMEWTNWEDIDRGIDVLTQTLRKLTAT